MRLVMTLLVRDEADIVAANLDYHLARGVDYVVATDNRSRDGTRAILEGYAARGLLHLIDEPADDYAQGRWVTRMARLACTDFGADWVINSDADEFWWPEGAADLKAALAAAPAGVDALVAPRHNFLPRAGAAGEPLSAMTVREAHSRNALGEPLPGKVCHRAFADIEVGQGNHEARRGGAPLAAAPAGLCILHFPLRSYAQFENKIRLGGAAYGRNAELPKETGHAWRMLYERYLRGELRDYYRTQEADEAKIDKGLAEGRYVRDERLLAYLRARGTGAAAR